MKFSVRIAHYNNAALFRNCYESLLSQSYKDWEAIIRDDTSSYREKSQIQVLISGAKRFMFFENEKNSGVGVTKSKLVGLASGDICGFVDPDDVIRPSAIEKAVHGMKIPEAYPGRQEIFNLLLYQNSNPYRIKRKIFITLQKLFR